MLAVRGDSVCWWAQQDEKCQTPRGKRSNDIAWGLIVALIRRPNTHFRFQVCASQLPPCTAGEPGVGACRPGQHWVYVAWHRAGHTPLLWSLGFTHAHHTQSLLLFFPPPLASWFDKSRGCPDFRASLILEGLHPLCLIDFRLCWTRHEEEEGRVGPTAGSEPPGALSCKHTDTYHRLEARTERDVRSTSNKHTVGIQFRILPRHKIKENAEKKFFQIPPCCFVGFLSTSVLTWIGSQINLAWFPLGRSCFASISVYSSKDSRRPIKVCFQTKVRCISRKRWWKTDWFTEDKAPLLFFLTSGFHQKAQIVLQVPIL